MSFGRFPGFDDPFFARDARPSFSMGFPMLGFPSERRLPHTERRPGNMLMPHDPFSIFNHMERMMTEMPRMSHESGDGQYFSSSSVMHFSSTSNGDGQPKVYHATSSVTQGPGGLKETRKSECDSESGMKKMAIGHHIGDRSHTIERRKNMKTKEQEQHQEFINLDDTEADTFDREWKEKTRSVRYLKSGDHHHDFSNRRGIGYSSEVHPSGSQKRPRNFELNEPREEEGRQRVYRSRSPEKHSNSSHPVKSGARRREYSKKDKHVHF